jgi:hypothetical protein
MIEKKKRLIQLALILALVSIIPIVIGAHNSGPKDDTPPGIEGVASVPQCTSDSDCEDGNLCTNDKCNKEGQCESRPNKDACDDGNAYTTGDKCSQGECVGGNGLSCDDGNDLTADSCDPATGCINDPIEVPVKEEVNEQQIAGPATNPPAPRCPGDKELCGDKCKDLQKDNGNCGSCGNKCPRGQTCTDGVCSGSPCQTGQTLCGDKCKDLQSDKYNCGACGNKCKKGETCTAGVCSGPSCPAGQTLCSDKCKNLQSDKYNCGACGNKCKKGETCTAGVCSGADLCVNGQTQSCTYTGPTGTENVGVCKAGTKTCSAGSWGTCTGEVLPTTEVCDNVDNDCDGTVDNGNPGGNVACNTGLQGACAAGTTACTAGTLVCNQNQQSSPEVCDGLDNDCNGQVDDGLGTGQACSPGQICIGGACVSCPTGQIACTNACVDTTSDSSNCGGCGQACIADLVCSGGVCALSCNSDSDCPPATDACHVAGTCNQQTKVCNAQTNVAAGTNCDLGDNNPCNVGACDGHGVCVGHPVDCNDNDVCTRDACRAGVGCDNGPIDCDKCQLVTCPPINTPCKHNECVQRGQGTSGTATCEFLSSPYGTQCSNGNGVCDGYGNCIYNQCAYSATCTVTDLCHIPGPCNPQTGTCDAETNAPSGKYCGKVGDSCIQHCDGNGGCSGC